MQTYTVETSVTSEISYHHHKHNFYCQNIYRFTQLTLHSDAITQYWIIGNDDFIAHLEYLNLTVRSAGISIHNDKLHHPYLGN